jgi:hypothetical protein
VALAGGGKVVMTASAAEGAAKKPKRVQEVLQYIKEHPIDIKSQPMYYEAQPPTPLPEVIRWALTVAASVTSQPLFHSLQ